MRSVCSVFMNKNVPRCVVLGRYTILAFFKKSYELEFSFDCLPAWPQLQAKWRSTQLPNFATIHSGMCLLRFDNFLPLCLVTPFIFMFMVFFLILQNHTDALIFLINTFQIRVTKLYIYFPNGRDMPLILVIAALHLKLIPNHLALITWLKRDNAPSHV